MKPASVRQRGIDKWLAQIDPPARALQHALDQIAHRGIAEHERRAIGDAAASEEDPVGGVQPHFFDRWVIEIGLQRAEAGECREHLTQTARFVINRRDAPRRRKIVVPAQFGTHDICRAIGFGRGVKPLGANALAHALGDGCGCWTHGSIITNSAQAGPELSTGQLSRPMRYPSNHARHPRARHGFSGNCQDC